MGLHGMCDLGTHLSEPREMILPRQVVHGDESADNIGRLVGAPSGQLRTALVVCDRIVAQLRLHEGLLKSLTDEGWKSEVYDEVDGEPTVSRAAHVADAALAVAPSLVVGVGGGSAMDLAKVAALCVANGVGLDAIGDGTGAEAAIPLVLVPTTTGTGAEATAVAVLTGPDGKRVVRHRSLVPMIAVLDALLVVGLPPAVTAATGMDALAHAAESWMSTASSPLSVHASLRAADLLVTWLPRAYAEPGDLEARRATLYGAFLAGVGLNAGVVLGHSMAYTVTNRSATSHGVSCAMALPFCVRFNADSIAKPAAPLARALTGGTRDDLESAVDSVRTLADSFDMPSSPGDVGIAAHLSDEMVRECANVYHRPNNPAPMTEATLEPLYQAWFNDDLAAAGLK